jgi:hypothetical protein
MQTNFDVFKWSSFNSPLGRIRPEGDYIKLNYSFLGRIHPKGDYKINLFYNLFYSCI